MRGVWKVDLKMKCVVSYCENKRWKKHCIQQRITFHRIPKKEPQKFQWLQAIRTPTQTANRAEKLYVCSEHFHPSDFRKKAGNRTLLDNMVPSIFYWRQEEHQDPKQELVLPDEHNELDTLSQKILNLEEENAKSRKKLRRQNLKYQVKIERFPQLCQKRSVFAIERFKNIDKKMFYYTGLPDYKTFIMVFEIVLPSQEPLAFVTVTSCTSDDQKLMRRSKLSLENQLFMVLVRLRRGLKLQTLADMFNLSRSYAQYLFAGWINLMYHKLGSLNIWPHRDVLIEHASKKFKQDHPNVIGSIDCTELIIEKRTSVVQSQCNATYKSNTTLKALIMADPNGTIIYLSPLMTGSMSDQEIVVKGGFFDTCKRKLESGHLLPGDIILADHGFKIQDIFAEVPLHINIPIFRITGQQFSEEDVMLKRTIAKGRVHVERAIGRLKTFRILAQVIPIAMIGSINQIFLICCVLSLFRPLLRK